MDSQHDDISNLAQLLKDNGDQILNATSKLSLSTTLLRKLNMSLEKLNHKETYRSSFHVTNTLDIVETFFDIQLLYDFIQKTLALKILPGCDVFNNKYLVDINLFKNLKLLEVHRFSMGLIKGIKSLRTQLEYLTCMRSLNTLKEVLENCGADKCQGFIWSELKEAVFSHNGLNNLDGSLEFVPSLNSLDLSHNYIQNAQPLNCLTNLKYLNLSYNNLESIPIFTGNLCNNLQILILRNNHIDNIREIVFLSNLRELDLSDNCLCDHSNLSSLSYLPYLNWLCLVGNPISLHSQHRNLTVKHLHANAASLKFKLDYVTLSRSERRLTGSFRPVHLPLERSSSFDSTTTASTVIRVEKNATELPQSINCVQQNSTVDDHAHKINISDDISAIVTEQIINADSCMQDSGFVAGPRPVSPSECSIGSAHSLNGSVDGEKTPNQYESDIEVLSNPSQSSIEVLGSGSAYARYCSSTFTIHTIYETSDLKKTSEEDLA